MYTPSLSEYTFYYLVLSDFEQDGKNFAGGPVCFVSSRRMYYEDPVVCNSAPPGIAHKPKKEQQMGAHTTNAPLSTSWAAQPHL